MPHQNAPFTPEGRRRLIERIIQDGRPISHVADEAGVRTPFTFADGDVLPLVLEHLDDGRWRLLDGGRVAGHADLDGLPKWSEARIEDAVRIMEANGAHRDPDLLRGIGVRSISDEAPDIYELADFVMALVQVAGLPHLFSKQSSLKFVTSGQDLLEERVPESLRIRNWVPERTDGGLFKTDMRVMSPSDQPLLLFFVSSEEKADRTSTVIRQYRDWGVTGSPVAVTNSKAERSAAGRRMRVLLGDPGPQRWERVDAEVGQWDGLLSTLERHGVPLVAPG